MSLAEVKLHTVPSTWVNAFCDPLPQPYRRVVGMEYGQGMPVELWARSEWRPEAAYDPLQTQPEVISLPQLSAQRLVGFFQRYFAEAPNWQYKEDPETGIFVADASEGYNCHRFGYWMRGTLVADRFEVPAAPDHIVGEGYAVKGSLPAGKHGVFGYKGRAGHGAAEHSVVGLGEDTDECLQVIAMGGFMGIDTYDHALDTYDKARTKNIGLYAI